MIISRNPHNKSDVSYDTLENHHIWHVKITKSNPNLLWTSLGHILPKIKPYNYISMTIHCTSIFVTFI